MIHDGTAYSAVHLPGTWYQGTTGQSDVHGIRGVPSRSYQVPAGGQVLGPSSQDLLYGAGCHCYHTRP